VLNRRTVILIFTLLALIANTSIVFAQTPDISLKKCKHWNKQIEQLKDRRRAGGTAKQMDNWKKSRRKYQQAFRSNDCADWRDELD